MEDIFYQENELVALLEERPGEKLAYIGLTKDMNGNLSIARHIFLNSMKYIDSYIYKDGVLSLVGHSPINIQVSHGLYKQNYNTIIEN